jgi:hypothetical protein
MPYWDIKEGRRRHRPCRMATTALAAWPPPPPRRPRIGNGGRLPNWKQNNNRKQKTKQKNKTKKLNKTKKQKEKKRKELVPVVVYLCKQKLIKKKKNDYTCAKIRFNDTCAYSIIGNEYGRRVDIREAVHTPESEFTKLPSNMANWLRSKPIEVRQSWRVLSPAVTDNNNSSTSKYAPRAFLLQVCVYYFVLFYGDGSGNTTNRTKGSAEKLGATVSFRCQSSIDQSVLTDR